MSVTVHHGDCREVLATLPDASVDSVVCDPPYHLTSIVKRFGSPDAAPAKKGKTGAYARASKGFMGKTWDGGDVAFQPETWAAVLRVMKPGAHLVAFGGTRTYHRMACAIEDAGFEVRDQIGWLYGSGFPKSHDVSKGIDKAAGAERAVTGQMGKCGMATAAENYEGNEKWSGLRRDNPATPEARQWQGWGTALKPAFEPIILARKPFKGTVAANVLQYGTGALNVDGCRIAAADGYTENAVTQGVNTAQTSYAPAVARRTFEPAALGRWPANVVLSYPEDEYLLRPDASREQKAELYRWMSENA